MLILDTSALQMQMDGEQTEQQTQKETWLPHAK